MQENKKIDKPLNENKDFKYLVRVSNTDLNGKKHILYALPKIKGVSVMMANAICKKANVNINKKTGFLSEQDVSALNKAVVEIEKSGLPSWMFNRRKDFDTGDDKHLLGGNLDFTREMDLKRLKKTKSYKGLRHQWGLTVRGQRTKSNFRKNKGKGSLGVQKKKGKSGKV